MAITPTATRELTNAGTDWRAVAKVVETAPARRRVVLIVAGLLIGSLAVAVSLVTVLVAGRTESVITSSALLTFALCLDCAGDAVAPGRTGRLT